jgi:hypothetical protein
MKSLTHAACLVATFFTLSACQLTPFGILDKELNSVNPLENTAKISKNKAVDSLAVLLRSLAPKPETFTFRGEKEAIFTTSKGTKINVANAVFVNEKGDIIKDNIVLTIQELHTPSDMLLADKPTNTSKINGHLESFGEFKLTATHEGKPVQLQSGSRLTVETEVENNGKRQALRMPIWDADTNDILEQTRGLNHLAEPTVVRQFFRQQRGAMWKETTQKAETNAFNRLQFDITKLNQWKNCDIFTNDTTPKATALVHFTQNLAPSVFDGETTTQAAVVYFKPLGINGLIKFYQPILNAPLSKSGFYSEENSLPIGTRGTLIAVSFINGKLYAAQQNITITAPRSNEKAAFFTLHPVETPPSVFLTNLRHL